MVCQVQKQRKGIPDRAKSSDQDKETKNKRALETPNSSEGLEHRGYEGTAADDSKAETRTNRFVSQARVQILTRREWGF